jgi:hypothetical protein
MAGDRYPQDISVDMAGADRKIFRSGSSSDKEFASRRIVPRLTSRVPVGTVETAINVGEVYVQLARDLHDGAYRTPGFDHALANARLIETVRAAKWGPSALL